MLLDLAGLIERAGKQGWALVALDIGVDTSSLSGRAMAGMMAVFSELERGMMHRSTWSRATEIRAFYNDALGALPPDSHQPIMGALAAGRTEALSSRSWSGGSSSSAAR